MPSLRRTFSAPSRSSPYCNTPQTRTSSRSPRRSSGSDTSNRRVLADIDWWRVEAAQREVRGLAPHEQLRPASPASSDEDEQEREQEERSPSPSPSPVATPAYNAGSSSDVPLWHSIPGAGWDVFDSFASEHPFGHIESADPVELPSTIQQLAALSLNPLGRASLHRTASSSSAFSDVSSPSSPSFSSSPSSSSSSTPTRLSMGFEDLFAASDSDDENDVPYAVLSRAGPRRPTSLPIPLPGMSARAVSYSAVESELAYTRDYFSYSDEEDEDSHHRESEFERGIEDAEDLFF